MELTDKDREHIAAVPSSHWCLAQRGNMTLVLGIATMGCFASAGWTISDAAFADISGRKFSWDTGEDEHWTDDRSEFLRPTPGQIERHMTRQLLAYIKDKYRPLIPAKPLATVVKELQEIGKQHGAVSVLIHNPFIGEQGMYADMYNKLVNSAVHTDTGRQLVELTYVHQGVHRQQVQLTFTGSIDHFTHEELTKLGEDIRTSVGLLILAKASAEKNGSSVGPEPTGTAQ